MILGHRKTPNIATQHNPHECTIGLHDPAPKLDLINDGKQ